MNIDLDAARWEKTKVTYTKWWNHELRSPLVPLVLRDRDPARSKPDVPVLKLIQLYGDFDVLDAVAGQLGSAQGIHLKDAVASDGEDAIRKLARQ